MNAELAELLEAAINRLRRAKHTVALTGAGISTPSGIPDFRSPQSGLWEQHNPAEVASIYGFRHDPKGFYDWIRPLAHMILEAQPNAAHIALARMEAIGKLQSVTTQNIDMLHTRAGSRVVYELHGHLREATCIHCFRVYPARPLIDAFLESGRIPTCPDCGHILKPNAILYGEQLPAHALIPAQRDARMCDVMLVAGSSLEVYPAADLPVIARRSGASLIFVNLSETPIDSLAEIIIHADVADALPHIASALENERSP
jgi:NAD-dependent deacetylase